MFAGLGSTATAQGERLSALIVSALRKAGVRGIIQSGWAGLQGETTDVLTVGAYRTRGCSPTGQLSCTTAVRGPRPRRCGLAWRPFRSPAS
ncbi:hypothetical protein [Mycolicibacterium wolinskyi]|uniref:hypothetical protein n=1 Tax=Mycolicibacterium wolinskyi TaxID=59750 RepID=UPI00082BBDB9|nr:hypothetical protein [Mycolicibacterium wolinskyi]